MVWNGTTLADVVKTELYAFLSNAISEASRMNNTQYSELLKKKYSHSGHSFWTKQYKGVLNARTEGIGITFRDPIPVEIGDEDTITLTWSMVARQIRAWEYEKAHENSADNKEDNMARKLKLDTSITKDIMAAASDSFVDSIKMIDVSEISPSSDNFYELSGLELLADDIEREGLKHNLVVCKKEQDNGYWLKSGHRRLAALKMLIDQGRRTSTKVPCYVDGEKSRADALLDLIMLNATQRRYTDAELMSEYEQLSKTLKDLESEGKGLNGRMRENIAKLLNISNGQVGKLDNIKHNAAPEVQNAVKNGEMSISTANEVAKLAPEKQKEVIEKTPDITSAEVKKMQDAKPKKEKAAPPDPDETETTEDEEDTEDFEGEIAEDEDACTDEIAKESTKSNATHYMVSLSGDEAEQLYKFLTDDYDDFREKYPIVADVIAKLSLILNK